MHLITANSVSDALTEALMKMKNADRETSRVGDVLVMPRPVMTEYQEPLNRVLFSPMRDANPFFHVMEAMWMLAGRNDLAWPLTFNSRFGSYSDDGRTIYGAYGWRWRSFFGYDQLKAIIQELTRNPNSRRAVLSMWNPSLDAYHKQANDGEFGPSDLGVAMNGGKDVPCNTAAYFDCRGGRLNMTVVNRSNDAIWGCYGANAVHFSFLLEYMAAHIGVPVGVYRQFSNNLHIYTEVLNTMVPDEVTPRAQLHKLALDVEEHDLYARANTPMPLALVHVSPEAFDNDLRRFMLSPGADPSRFEEPFFKRVVVPMYEAYMLFKRKEYGEALVTSSSIGSWDWRSACTEWLERRRDRAAAKKDAK